ncbi:MAG: NADH-quinone oxidoreductase subunit NuoE [SAR86 cluster bacterium]|uniref:NADH-quinone oxidoreductase subunit E n=1 Tax=SAR86 cluster bacterium TaxID=2030880 RepID=A0A2A5BBN3_9GAMM|nr:MAG: NADH-quinone oxidoreductase subunit NuoE [SAR86 cluster bacterium]
MIASTATRHRKLSAEEIAEIEHEMTLYPDKKAVGLEALKIVQKYQGWVSDESLLGISKYLGIPASDLEGVATFFNLVYREPVGKNVILFCDSVSCWIMGCEGIKKHIKDTLDINYGETTKDGDFTLIPVPCLGDCDRAPVMMVGPDLHRNLTPGAIDKIILDYSKSKSAE